MEEKAGHGERWSVSRICDVRRVQQKRNKSCVRRDGQPSRWSRSVAKMEVGKQPRYETSEMKLDNGGVNNRDWRNCDSGRQHPRVKEDRESLDEVGSE